MVVRLILLLAVLGTCLFLILRIFFLRNRHVRDGWKTFLQGFRDGLRGSGFLFTRPRHPVELWVWETMQDEDVCEDCLQKASWRPMDIADWMESGLPRTPECETACGENCRCRLVRYVPSKRYTPRGQ